jgi:hypothetical protein
MKKVKSGFLDTVIVPLLNQECRGRCRRRKENYEILVGKRLGNQSLESHARKGG